MKTAVLFLNDRALISRVELATSWWQRMLGLLGRAGLPEGHAMFLSPANSIHMFFMRFAIDLIFVDRNLKVVKVVRNVRPWRTAFGGRAAHSVFELAAGWLPEDAVGVGDVLELRRA